MWLLNLRVYTLTTMDIDKWSSGKVVSVYPPASNVLKFPLIFLTSVYKFRKWALAPFLTVPVLWELLFPAPRVSLSAKESYFFFQHCLAIIKPSLIPHFSPVWVLSVSVPVYLSFSLSLPHFLGYATQNIDPHSGQGFFVTIFLSGNLEAT